MARRSGAVGLVGFYHTREGAVAAAKVAMREARPMHGWLFVFRNLSREEEGLPPWGVASGVGSAAWVTDISEVHPEPEPQPEPVTFPDWKVCLNLQADGSCRTLIHNAEGMPVPRKGEVIDRGGRYEVTEVVYLVDLREVIVIGTRVTA